MKSFVRTVFAFIAATALLAAPAVTNASPFVMTLEQIGSDVVATGTGSIDDLPDLHYAGTSGFDAFLTPNTASLGIGSSASNVDFYSGLSGPTPSAFGAGSNEIDATSWMGDAVGISGSLNILAVPAGYVSGDLLVDTMTFHNQTFATLGINPGTYIWKWGSGAEVGQGSFTVEVAPTPVPTTLPLFATGLGALGLLRWRRKRKIQTSAHGAVHRNDTDEVQGVWR